MRTARQRILFSAEEQQRLQTLISLAKQFPRIQGFKRWKVLERKYGIIFVIHVTPEERVDNTVPESLIHMLRDKEEDIFMALNRSRVLGDMTDEEYETFRLNLYVTEAQKILTKITEAAP